MLLRLARLHLTLRFAIKCYLFNYLIPAESVMDKRYQVFLSSTFADLEDERKEVMAALQKAGFFVAGMELFPSDDSESWDVIKRVIDQCDYYVLVIAGRYGSIGPDGKSFTEMEYDYAKEKGLPVLAFLHKDPSTLPHKNVESKNPDKLSEFKARVEKNHNRRSWSNRHGLATEVLASISQATNLRPQVGWVRGDAAELSQDLSGKLEDLRVETEKLRKEKDGLSDRLKQLGDDHQDTSIAWGNDEVELAFTYSPKGGDDTDEATLVTQWNRVFDLIAPKLIGWQSSYNATAGVNSMLKEEASRVVDESVDLKFHGLTEDSVCIIRNQFLALKLINVETETKESGTQGKIRGIFTYQVELWRLSELGLMEYATSKALRRDDR